MNKSNTNRLTMLTLDPVEGVASRCDVLYIFYEIYSGARLLW